MFQLKLIIRNLRRGGIYSAINIGGLAIGMAAAVLILVFVYHEWSYDHFHAKEKNLYVVYKRSLFDGVMQCSDVTPKILGPTLKDDYPEIAGVTRMKKELFLYAKEEVKFKILTGITDPDFLDMFDFPLLQGSRETALSDPYSVIITEKVAKRLFGRSDPMGQMLLLNNQYPMKVTAVMKDMPGNTLFRDIEVLAPITIFKSPFDEDWTASTVTTFVEIHPDARLESVNSSISRIIKSHTKDEARGELFLHQLGKQHLYSKFENGVATGGLIEIVRLFGLIAGLILLIACINFMNLSTARSEKRAREVGVRKVIGGKRLSLIGLFLYESLTVSVIAGACAFVLVVAVLPLFRQLTGQPLTMNPASIGLWLSGLGFILFTGLLAGGYPALFLSSFQPINVLKGLFRKKQCFFSSRKILVIVQFSVVYALIVSTLVIHRQINHAQGRELGYNKDQLIYMPVEGNIVKNYDVIKHDLMSSGTVVSMTKCSSPMTQGWINMWSINWKGKDPNARLQFDVYFIDADWTKTVGTTLIEGRDIDINNFQTDSTAMIISESALKVMNFDDPLGETVRLIGKEWHIVGVVKDFILNSPYETVAPMVIGGPAGNLSMLHIKLNGQNRMADNLIKLEQVFRLHNPAYPFEYKFVDETYARKFQEEQKLGSLAAWFSGLTIFISCLGLFALVAYMAETRRKEIGIRKVLGASVSNIIVLLSKEFLVLVLISFLIASPVAWWAMSEWLSGYAYRTNIPWWLFVAVGCLSLCIALLTVGFQAVKAATANPVKAIKN